MSEKHKRIIKEQLTKEEINQTLQSFSDSFERMGAKQQHLLQEWLLTWKTYISFEERFQPERLKYYKRGEIVLAQFGYNVGSELGGSHYAIVIENDNNCTNSVVTVIPISSLSEDKTPDDLHPSCVYLGKIIPGVDKKSYAMPLQIRAISKLRIIKPKKPKDGVYKVSSEKLSEIDAKMIELFTKK